MRSDGWTATTTCGKKAPWLGSRAPRRFCRWGSDARNQFGRARMALKMPKLAGNKSAMAAGDTNIEIPTTQVKMTQQASAVTYDPLASVSIMEQLRSASAQ